MAFKPKKKSFQINVKIFTENWSDSEISYSVAKNLICSAAIGSSHLQLRNLFRRFFAYFAKFDLAALPPITIIFTSIKLIPCWSFSKDKKSNWRIWIKTGNLSCNYFGKKYTGGVWQENNKNAKCLAGKPDCVEQNLWNGCSEVFRARNGIAQLLKWNRL